MDQKVLRIDDLDPDGLRVRVNWENMDVESSIFIPCVDTEKCGAQLSRISKRKEWKFEVRISIEEGKLGLRAWRTV